MDDWHLENPEVDSPDGGKHGFPPASRQSAGKNFFVPKLCNHCADSPCTQVCPVGATFVTPDGVVLVDQKVLPGLPLLRAGLPLRLPLPPSDQANGREMHALLSPDHQGTDHRVLRSLSHRRAAACGSEESQGSDSRVLEDPQRAGSETPYGHGAKVFYNGLDGSVR